MINIIGAGPAGCYTAYLLAKSGKDVQVFEEHPSIGSPVQCTGIVTEAVKDIVPLKKDVILNTVENVRVIAPDGRSAKLKLHKKEYVIDRRRFDNHLADMAIKEGAEIYLSHEFLGCSGENILIRDKKNNKIKNVQKDIIIGADGPLSRVAKSAGLLKDRKFITGIQARIKIKNDSSTYKTYFGDNFPGFFGWAVPESADIARVGLASHTNTRMLFERFVKRFAGNIIEKQAGVIPIFNRKTRVAKDNVYLVGDSACQVKNSTGGGLFPGLKAAELLSQAITQNKDYPKLCRENINRNLNAHALLRRFLDTFSDKDYSTLTKILENHNVQDVIEMHSRENPYQLLTKIILKEPRLFLFLKNILKTI